MDAFQMFLCPCCDIVIEDNHAASRLRCGHSLHTYCFIEQMLECPLLHLECPICETDVVPPSLINGADNSPVPTDISGAHPDPINHLYDTNRQFKKDVKIYHQQRLKAAMAEKKARAINKQKYKEFIESIKDLKTVMKTKRKEAQLLIRQSVEYKTYKKEVKTWQALEKKLKETYPAIQNIHHLTDALHTRRGLTRWPRVHPYTAYLLYCGFRIRI